MLGSILKHFNHIWFVLVAAVLTTLLLNPEWLSRESIAQYLAGLGTMALLVYIALSLSRALLMIPCTPFVFAGGIAFPQWPLLVLLISVAGIVAGATLVYSFPSFGSYDDYLESKYPEKVALLKRKMQSPYAFWFVVGWSFFPLVPTDAICYVAGMAKMSYKKLISALLLGELPLVVAYIYIGVEAGEWLRTWLGI